MAKDKVTKGNMFGSPEKLSKQQPPKSGAPSTSGRMKHEVMNDKMASKLGC